MNLFFYLILLLVASPLLGESSPLDPITSPPNGDLKEETLKIGILSFPTSQQPTPLISFGQNLLEAHQTQARLITNEVRGAHQYSINLVPSVLYAFTNETSILISAPFDVRNRVDNHHSSGGGDLIIEGEYAFYTKPPRDYYYQGTVLANISIPTGSTHKNPNTGVGSNTIFIGETFSRNSIDWLSFASLGSILTTTSHRTKLGNQFLYQCGIGRRIYNNEDWLFAWMIEFTGTFAWRNRINGLIDHNSGGNTILCTPSLWISSSKSLIIQIGGGFPVLQNPFGHQNNLHYLLECTTAWTF